LAKPDSTRSRSSCCAGFLTGPAGSAHGTDDQRREAPLASNGNAHFLEGNTQHLQGGHILAARFLRHDRGFRRTPRENRTATAGAQAVEQGADEGLFQFAHLRRGADVLGQHAGQVGAQEIFLQLVGVALVLQVLEEQHGDRDIAHRLEAEDDHRPRHRADRCRRRPAGSRQN
jgi:hypothetical protein